MKDYENDQDYLDAMSQLYWALDDGYHSHQAKAIDDLITIRLALMMEAQADKIQEKIKEMGEPQPLSLSGIGHTES